MVHLIIECWKYGKQPATYCGVGLLMTVTIVILKLICGGEYFAFFRNNVALAILHWLACTAVVSVILFLIEKAIIRIYKSVSGYARENKRQK